MDFKQQMLENMQDKYKIKCKLPERDELLEYLHNMMLFTGRGDIMYCNSFLNEATQLLTNSIFLYEDGYFDCAFYSVRQASEVFDTMLYLSNSDENELKKWNVKDRFLVDSKIRSQLEKMAYGYEEIKTILSNYFEHHRELINKSHKIIHKQGFDTFYTNLRQYKSSHEEFKELFIETLKYTIGIGIILFVILEPLALALADGEVDSKLNFNFMTEPIDCEYFDRFLGLTDVINRLLDTNYYKGFIAQFKDKECMNMATYSVVRDNAWDVASLDEIEKQIYLLNTYEQYMFSILKLGLRVSNFYYQNGWGWYITTYESKHIGIALGSEVFKKFLDSNNKFNQKYDNIYISVVTMYDDNLLIEHNELLSEKEIDSLVQLENQSNKEYTKFCDCIKV